MTPLELREKAFTFLEIAKSTLNKSPATSWYNAGYTLELYLKAILCRKRGWSQFPQDIKELNKLNALAGFPKENTFTHNIDELLKYSDLIFLKKSSYKNIDWDTALEWSEQIRYKSESDITLEKASACLNEIESAVQELQTYELLYYIQSIELELTKNYGPFDCFIMAESEEKNKWDIIASWSAPSENIYHKRQEELNLIIPKTIPEDLIKNLHAQHSIGTANPLIQGIIQLVQFLVRSIYQQPRYMFKNNIISGYPEPPNGFYITVGRWDPKDLIQEWKEIGLYQNEEHQADPDKQTN